MIPQRSEMLPQPSEMVPQRSEMVPQPSEIIPRPTEMAPHAAEMIKQHCGTISVADYSNNATLSHKVCKLKSLGLDFII